MTTSSQQSSAADESTADAVCSIGPWKPRGQGQSLEFIREGDWDKYLWLEERDVLRASRTSIRLRVCVVGESVAAGMFFAPAITPSKLLLSALQNRAVGDDADVEVIDLSRNAMRAKELVRVVDAATQLEPDVIVVFAGNNFCRDRTVGRPDAPKPPRAYVEAAARGGAGGVVKVVEAYHHEVGSYSREVVSDIATIAAGTNARVIWLIPHSNPHWPRLAPCPWLGASRTQEWHAVLSAARRALEEEAFAAALELGRELIALDNGCCPTSQRVLVEALRGLGDLSGAAEHAQREVDIDAALQRETFIAPGLHSQTRSAIVAACSESELEYVDLATVFSEHSGSPFTASGLFVDYCHLSTDGMQLAVDAVATKIDAAKEGLPSPIGVAPQITSRALFDAAVYNSHLGFGLDRHRDREHTRIRFQSALEHCEEIAGTMRDYVRMRAAISVAELSASTQRLVAGANSTLDFGILRWVEGLDAGTIVPLCSVLKEAGFAGDELLADYEKVYTQALSGGCDISDPAYLECFARDGVVDWDPERGTRRTQPYLRARWPDLGLEFPSPKAGGIHFTLTTRLPSVRSGSGGGSTGVFINGTLVAEVTSSDRWTQSNFRIEQSMLRAGFNLMTLSWPPLAPDKQADCGTEARSDSQVGPSDWWPVFGEVFSIRARADRS